MTAKPLPPPTPVIETERLTLRPTRADDWLAHREERS
jgi:hypothetical protein